MPFWGLLARFELDRALWGGLRDRLRSLFCAGFEAWECEFLVFEVPDDLVAKLLGDETIEVLLDEHGLVGDLDSSS